MSQFEYVPMEEPTTPTAGTGEAVTQADIDIATSLTADKLLKAIDASSVAARHYADAAAEQVKQAILPLIKTQKTCMHVKINELPPVQLKEEVHPALPGILTYLMGAPLNDRNVWLYGPKGSGKSTLVRQLATALNRPLDEISCTTGASSSQVTAWYNPLKADEFVPSPYALSYQNGGVFNFDEAGFMSPEMSSPLLNSLSLGELRLRTTTYQRHPNSVIIACDNTIGLGGDFAYVGRERQDAALLDRFLPVYVGYSDTVDEACCPDQTLRQYFQEVRKNLLERKSPETISPRLMRQAYTLLKLKWTPKDVYACITARFPSGLCNQVDFTEKSFTAIAANV